MLDPDRMRSLLVSAVVACVSVGLISPGQAEPSLSQTQAIARQAYVYGYPLVDLYRVYYQFFINDRSPEHTHTVNHIYNAPGLFSPANTTLQTPDADVLYSIALLDLRAQPYVLTLPAIQRNRYYSAQFVDQYTFNLAYAGTRTTGNGGGNFLVVGPNWKGTVPPRIKSVIHADTQYVLAVMRTQVFGSSDLVNARKIQAGYKVQGLSAFTHKPAPKAAPKIGWILPLSQNAETRALDFYNVLAFVLQFCPVDRSETSLRASFAEIGVKPGQKFHSATLPLASVQAIQLAMTAGQLDILATRQASTSSIALFGDRAQLKNNYVNRAAGAQLGILGNSAQETMSYPFIKDPNGNLLNGLYGRYTVRLAPNALPPVNAFWSLTMYQIPSRLLVQNGLNRYSIDSAMLPSLKRDPDGGITLYVQASSPGADLESNWLPAPEATFYLIMRLYYPKPQALNGQWKPAAIQFAPSPPPVPSPSPLASATPAQ